MMTRDQIKAVLEASEGKRVRVTYTDGEVESVDVSTVDEEGFVHSGPDGENQAGFWTRYEYIADVSTPL